MEINSRSEESNEADQTVLQTEFMNDNSFIQEMLSPKNKLLEQLNEGDSFICCKRCGVCLTTVREDSAFNLTLTEVEAVDNLVVFKKGEIELICCLRCRSEIGFVHEVEI